MHKFKIKIMILLYLGVIYSAKNKVCGVTQAYIHTGQAENYVWPLAGLELTTFELLAQCYANRLAKRSSRFEHVIW